jgi:8-oxo-dGTP pyrophosphatase MutT (NUDIX family)
MEQKQNEKQKNSNEKPTLRADGILVYGTPQPNEEKRKTISAVIQRKSDKKFLLVKWNKFGWIAPVIGGIDEGESPEQATEREVLEETGYKVKAIKKLGKEIESHFFAENKNVYRYRIDQAVLCELENETAQTIDEKEKAQQEVIWLTAEQAIKEITHSYNSNGIKRYLGWNESE